jgi:hypothetical protein
MGLTIHLPCYYSCHAREEDGSRDINMRNAYDSVWNTFTAQSMAWVMVGQAWVRAHRCISVNVSMPVDACRSVG